jgi:predicted PurR-regulated permease PerM
VKLHPVAVILVVAVGVELAGIVGALFAVPVMAVVRSVYLTLREQAPDDDERTSEAGETGETVGETGETVGETQPSGASGPG